MTKKDYIIIAGAIHRSGMAKAISEKCRLRLMGGEAMCKLIAIDLASSLQAKNPKFNRSKFMTACGCSDWPVINDKTFNRIEDEITPEQ